MNQQNFKILMDQFDDMQWAKHEKKYVHILFPTRFGQ